MFQALSGIVAFVTVAIGLTFWYQVMEIIKAPANMYFLFWTYCVSLVVLMLFKIAASAEDN